MYASRIVSPFLVAAWLGVSLVAGPYAAAKDEAKESALAAACAEALRATTPKHELNVWQRQMIEAKVETASPLKKVSLIPEAHGEEALRLQSIVSMNAENYGLKGYNRSSFEGLVQIFRDPVLTERFIKHWERLGFIRAQVRDPYYANFKLIGQNQPVDVTKEQADPVLQSYLKNLRNQALKEKIDPILVPVSPRQRMHTLISMFTQTLEQLDPTKADSPEIIKTVLMEIYRLKVEGQLTPESLDQTFAALSGFAQFETRDLRVPGIVSFMLGFVPWGNLIYLAPWIGQGISIYNNVFEQTAGRNRLIKGQFTEVNNVKVWQRAKPKSLEVIFSRRDFRDLKPKAYSFIDRYATRGVSLFSPEFAEDFMAAYPELNLLYSHATQETAVTSPFGEWHPEVQRVLYRAALVLALYKNDSTAFSKLERREFGILRRKMFGNLGLLDDGKVTVDEIDLLMTFFITDVLGRAQSPLLDAIDEDFHVSKVVGQYDFERRSAFLLKRYTLLSYSFARQSNADQQLILSLLDGVFTLNMEHILRLDASAASFDALKEMGSRQLSFLFYRNLLSFAGNVTDNLQSHSQNLTSVELSRWMSLKSILDRASKEGSESKSLYQEYLTWVSELYDIPADSRDNMVILRLASIAGLNKAQGETLKRRYLGLPESDRDILVRYMTNSPTLIYGGHDFFDICMRTAKDSDIGRFADRLDFWLKTLTKIYRALDLDPTTRKRIQNTREGDVRLFVEPVADLISRQGADSLQRSHYFAERFKFGYIIHVGLQ